MDSRSRQEATLERGLRLRNDLQHRAREWRSRTDEEDIVTCARVDSALSEQAPPPLRAYACALRTFFFFTCVHTLAVQQMHNGYQQSTSSYNTADDVLVRLLSAEKKYNDNICQNVSDWGEEERK